MKDPTTIVLALGCIILPTITFWIGCLLGERDERESWRGKAYVNGAGKYELCELTGKVKWQWGTNKKPANPVKQPQ